MTSAPEGMSSRPGLLGNDEHGQGIFRFRTAEDIRSEPEPTSLVEGILSSLGIACLYGPSGVGKTFLTLHLAAAIASGNDWFGHKTKQGRVVYVALEGRTGLRNRIAAWEQHHGRFPEDVWFVDGRNDFNLPTDAGILGQAINAEGGAALVVIDPLNRAALGIDENSSHDMDKVVRGAGGLQSAIDGSVLLVHHTGKEVIRGLRGHSSLHAALDSVIEIAREGMHFRWTVVKSRDGEDGVSHAFDLLVVKLDQTTRVPQ